ncbi:MAG TPA: DUF2975 domain-containing protein [Propionibacterium sp.]|nr:DUF2975 domain-containing protein [Propionibacterium sp.]
MSRPLRLSLWTLIVLLVLGVLLVAGLFLPLLAVQTAESNPEYAHLAWPFLATFWAACAAAVVALGAAGNLVELAAAGRLLTPATQRPLAVAIGAFGLMAALFLGVNAVLTFVVRQNHPSIFLALLGLGLVCLAAALALVAARGQVARAAALADEVEAFV